MADKEFTYSDVSEHNTKKDLYIVVHDKVYNASSFVDEHPGGEEVLLDVGGQDSTEAFEDVGHSDEAREILEGLLVGTLKRQDGDPKPKTYAQSGSTATTTDGASTGVGLLWSKCDSDSHLDISTTRRAGHVSCLRDEPVTSLDQSEKAHKTLASRSEEHTTGTLSPLRNVFMGYGASMGTLLLSSRVRNRLLSTLILQLQR
ncbi:cytochrome b5-like heme/steroid binding domain-containing protein [Pyrenochaeta sp. MPI-SDFR-AT-0127]|nr:cytochrome b5-like heme/steroid binding domain-containing protein [Pyrenochaeta sp. MPI-SDFR-AT-0127]